ncbi:HET domain-containing protein [Fusarium sp. Ph1]|nr:HET domain-containing protein [Fusarium sp. Ph1]
MKLTTDNYDQMVKGVPSPQLPQLYQDALYVTRSLGVRYLWIDSLCIIQKGDNLADWNHEVTLMSEVYSRSLCNISASAAPDATRSLFNTRDLDTCFPETIECTFNGITSRYLISEDRYWDTEVPRSLVNTRAWVLQERLLADRVLHVGKRHLVWECKETLASDAYPEGLPRGGTSSDLSLKGMFPRPGLSSREYRHIWQIIVYLYANCKLTFPGDRLVALSALARTMGSFLQEEYVSGMWRDDLELDLLWCIDGFFGASTPTTYKAPTWSWVASVGHLFPADPWTDGQSLIKVEKVHLDYVTEDTWGMLRGGWLHLRGHLNKLSLIGPDNWKMVVNDVQVEVVTKNDMQLKIYLDTPNDERDKDSQANLYRMLARRTTNKYEDVVFVLLLELVDGESGTFKRKATFIRPSKGEDEFPCLEYVDGQHLICII